MITRILGIDPGLNRTGWGVIEIEGNRLRHIAHGVVTSDAADALSTRLSALYSELAKLIVTWQPDEAAVEEVFVNRNPSSTLKLGMARGVALLAPAMAGLPVGEYAANLVKKSIVGAGHADKAQVAMMVSMLLPGTNSKADAADALAVAICHAHHRSAPGRLAPVLSPSPPRGEGRGEGASQPALSRNSALAMPPSPDGFAATLSPEGRGNERVYQPKPGPIQISRARKLRTKSTDVEAVLWRSLRNGQLGTKFRRQAPVLNYVADFLSHDARLIVELDGGQHAESDSDERRTKFLEQAGFRVLRFWNNEVTENLEGVLLTIADALNPAPSPRPSPRGGEGVNEGLP